MSVPIPLGWTWVTLEDIAAPIPNAIVDGPFGSNLKLDDYVDSGVPVLQGKNVTGDQFKWFDIRFISRKKAAELKRSSVRVGDILIVKIGSIGYSAIVDDLMGFEHAIIPANLAKITPNTRKVDTRYLHQWLISLDAKRYLIDSASKTAQPALSLPKLKKLRVPLPPLEEQRRIAAVLDEAKALLAKRRHALTKLDTLTHSLFLEMFGNPLSNPKRNPITPLGEIAAFVGGGTPSRANPDFYTGSICWATPKDIKGEYLYDTQEHVTAAAVAKSATKIVPAHSILIVVKSKILMRRLPLLITKVEACFGQDIKAIIPESSWSAIFLAQHIKLSQAALLRQARGINTEGLTLDHLRRLPIMVVAAEQRRRYSERIEQIQGISTHLTSQRKSIDQCFASLQHRAFRGEL